jgi:predicted Ser/Thr protein kinase
MRESLHQIGDVITDTTQEPPRSYGVVGILGEGNSGITYSAEDTAQPGVTVALKVLSFQQTSDWKMLELFEREAKILSKLEHPGIPKYFNYFYIDTEQDRRFYIVQEQAKGKSLAVRAEEGWHSNEKGIQYIAKQILEILIYLQSIDPPVIHRDIKPHNIILDENNTVSLVDFGAVRDTYYSTLMRGSTVVGTYGYMAPEQFRGQSLPATDLYGLGATVIFLLTHRDPKEIPTDGLALDLQFLREKNGVSHIQISPEFVCWLEKMLEPEASERFVSAQEALTALCEPQRVVKKRKLIQPELILGAMLITGALCTVLLLDYLNNTFQWKIHNALGAFTKEMCGDINVVQDYLKQGGDANAIKRGSYIVRTWGIYNDKAPLLACVTETKIAELLLIHGANPNIRDDIGNSLLQNYIKGNNTIDNTITLQRRLELAKLLIKYGAHINAKSFQGSPLLHFAVMENLPEMANLLIEQGAEVNSKDSNNDTPLDIAIVKNNIEIARILLSKGAVANRFSKSIEFSNLQKRIQVSNLHKKIKDKK